MDKLGSQSHIGLRDRDLPSGLVQPNDIFQELTTTPVAVW